MCEFVDELSDVLSTVVAASDRLLIVGDFNCLGPTSTTIYPPLAELLDCMDMTQHVQSATRAQNLLDLLITDPSLAITGVRVDDAGLVSDHRLFTGAQSELFQSHSDQSGRLTLTSSSSRFGTLNCSARLPQQSTASPSNWSALSSPNWTASHHSSTVAVDRRRRSHAG